MDKCTEIQKVAWVLKKGIEKLERKLDEEKALLYALGNVCEHPTIQKYRGRETGTCEFCFREFASRSDIDAIFSE